MYSNLSLLCVLSMILVGCSYQSDVTSDPRFKGIVPSNARTKIVHRLYGFSDHPSSDNRYDLTITDQGSSKLVGFVPAGQPAKLARIIRYHDIGITWEQLEGEITFKGTAYPFTFDLGTSAYPNKWKFIFESFEAVE